MSFAGKEITVQEKILYNRVAVYCAYLPRINIPEFFSPEIHRKILRADSPVL